MTIRCPCGRELNGNDEQERSHSLKTHLIDDHGQEESSLRMLDVRESLGDDATNALLAMDLSKRAHLAPASRTSEEIINDSLSCGEVICVSEIPLGRELRGDYPQRIICPACGRTVGGDDDEQLNCNLAEHCNGHDQLKGALKEPKRQTVVSR